MDKPTHSKSKFCTSLTNDLKRSFYSDDDGEATPARPRIAKPSKFSKGDILPFQTDDSDCTPKKLDSPTSPKGQNKLSKFQQKEHDIEKDSDIPFENEESENQNAQQPQEYDLDAQAKLLEQKYQAPKPAFSPPAPFIKSNSSKQIHNVVIKDHPFRHLVYGKYVQPFEFMRFLQLVQSGLMYALHSLKGPSDKFLRSRLVRLKEGTKKQNKLLVLDLDETLIHSCTLRDQPQVVLTLKDEQESIDICFNVRPYCREFLKEMSNYYTIHLFTASSELYANAIVNHLDPKRQYISDILCRNNCFETKNGFFIKDLRIITNRHLKDIVIVDNLPHSFGLQLENGIPIIEWLQDPRDEELRHIQQYLIQLSREEDVRVCNRTQLKLFSLVDFKLNI